MQKSNTKCYHSKGLYFEFQCFINTLNMSYVLYLFLFSTNRLKIPPDCTTELNHHAYLFLQSIFDKHDLVSLPFESVCVLRLKSLTLLSVSFARSVGFVILLFRNYLWLNPCSRHQPAVCISVCKERCQLELCYQSYF